MAGSRPWRSARNAYRFRRRRAIPPSRPDLCLPSPQHAIIEHREEHDCQRQRNQRQPFAQVAVYRNTRKNREAGGANTPPDAVHHGLTSPSIFQPAQGATPTTLASDGATAAPARPRRAAMSRTCRPRTANTCCCAEVRATCNSARLCRRFRSTGIGLGPPPPGLGAAGTAG